MATKLTEGNANLDGDFVDKVSDELMIVVRDNVQDPENNEKMYGALNALAYVVACLIANRGVQSMGFFMEALARILEDRTNGAVKFVESTDGSRGGLAFAGDTNDPHDMDPDRTIH